MVDYLIKNKNIKIIVNNETLQLNLFVFNVLNGNKEEISFCLKRKENINKDEIIKYLSIKVDNLEEQLKEMNKKYDDLKEIVDGLIKKDKQNFNFVWTNHSNCQLSNGGKKKKNL